MDIQIINPSRSGSRKNRVKNTFDLNTNHN